jgi:IclR family transcriptional regulator, KDG regulon repressor
MPDAPLNSVHNAIKLLSLFRPEHSELGLTDIARRLGLTKQSTLRLLSTLELSGCIERVPGQAKYRLGLRLWEIGRNAIQRGDLYEICHPILTTLAEESGFGVRFTAYAHGEVINIDRVEGVHPLQVSTRLGERVPAYAVANGRPLLAYQPPAEIERVLTAGLLRYTDATITSPEALRAELAKVKREGIAIDRGEWREHVWGVCAPVFDEHMTAAYCVGVVGFDAQMEKAPVERLIGLVRDAACSISRALGAPTYPYPATPAPAPVATA